MYITPSMVTPLDPPLGGPTPVGRHWATGVGHTLCGQQKKKNAPKGDLSGQTRRRKVWPKPHSARPSSRREHGRSHKVKGHEAVGSSPIRKTTISILGKDPLRGSMPVAETTGKDLSLFNFGPVKWEWHKGRVPLGQSLYYLGNVKEGRGTNPDPLLNMGHKVAIEMGMLRKVSLFPLGEPRWECEIRSP
jgi:hypothetical protein